MVVGVVVEVKIVEVLQFLVLVVAVIETVMTGLLKYINITTTMVNFGWMPWVRGECLGSGANANQFSITQHSPIEG